MRALLLLVIVAAGAGLVGLRLFNTLPPLEGRTQSGAPTDTAGTTLGRAIEPLVDAHPGTAGIHALAGARDAFAARVLLARAAERSLDVQYYIWRNDTTGALLFEALRAAADRGVRVRLLLDDNNTSGMDEVLAALDTHSNIEVRLFNPFTIRRLRVLNYLTDFFRLNRRMHNKSFTADNQATIVGGRNVGDEYFGAAPEGELVFADLDVLAVGPIVRGVSGSFDRYWASGSAYPAERVLPPVAPAALDGLRDRASIVERDPAAASYVVAVRESPFVGDLVKGRLAFDWAPTRMVSDDPAKGLGRADRDALLSAKLAATVGAPHASLDVVSPYFVPTAAGVEAFTALAEGGVDVRVLINSLESTDVEAVHSGYVKHRRALLEGGVSLYEMRLASSGGGTSSGSLGSGASSLHAKTFGMDRQRLFVGSFNFDPRSTNLNTELGFVIESPALAGRLAAVFDRAVPAFAYEVHLSPEGEIFWTERRQETVVRHDEEPGTTPLQRAFVRFLSWLPIEWLL